MSMRNTLIVITAETIIPFQSPSAMDRSVPRYLFRVTEVVLFISLKRCAGCATNGVEC